MQVVADEYQEFLDAACNVHPYHNVKLFELYNAYVAYRSVDRYYDSKPVFAAIIGKVFSKSNPGCGVTVHGLNVDYQKLHSYLQC